MTKAYFTEEGVQVSGDGLDHLREATTEEAAYIATAAAALDDPHAAQAKLDKAKGTAERDASWQAEVEAIREGEDRE